jgi:hypothetical protein
MLVNRLIAVMAATAATVLLTGVPAPALAAELQDAPTIVSTELVSAEGDGCDQPAVQLGDGSLSVQAQTGLDASLHLSAREAAGQPHVSTECVLLVRFHFDQPATLKPNEYPMSGFAGTSAGTEAGHHLQSSFDATTWYGQSSTLQPSSSGPFYRSAYPRLAPRSACATEADVYLRVGLSLTAADGLDAADWILLEAPNGAVVLLAAEACS